MDNNKRDTIEYSEEISNEKDQYLYFNYNKPSLAQLRYIHRGVFGSVFQMYDCNGKAVVAMKRKVKNSEQESRETDILILLRKSKNVIHCYEVFQTIYKGKLVQNIIMEQMPKSLQREIDSQRNLQSRLSSFDIKCIFYQLLNGLREMHEMDIIHRDLKPDNVLLTNDDICNSNISQQKTRWRVKLADVGNSKILQSSETESNRFTQKSSQNSQVCYDGNLLTPHAVSLWYRPPELLAGQTIQSTKIDIWSAACILIELQTNKPLFEGTNEGKQLAFIMYNLGTPPLHVLNRWKNGNDLIFSKISDMPIIHNCAGLQKKFKNVNISIEEMQSVMDLTYKMLNYDTDERWSAERCMRHPYFDEVKLIFKDEIILRNDIQTRNSTQLPSQDTLFNAKNL